MIDVLALATAPDTSHKPRTHRARKLHARSARLEDEHSRGWILRETRRDSEARRATTNCRIAVM